MSAAMIKPEEAPAPDPCLNYAGPDGGTCENCGVEGARHAFRELRPSEAVALAAAVRARHRAAVEAARPAQVQRAVAARHRRPYDGPVPARLGSGRDLAAQAVGMSSGTLHRAAAVVAAAAQDPERFGDLLRTMDETGRIGETYRELRRRMAPEPGARHPIHSRTHRTDLSKIVERAIFALEGICVAFRGVDPADLGRRPDWAAALYSHTAEIRAFAKKVR